MAPALTFQLFSSACPSVVHAVHRPHCTFTTLEPVTAHCLSCCWLVLYMFHWACYRPYCGLLGAECKPKATCNSPSVAFAGVLNSICVTEHTMCTECKPKTTCSISFPAFCCSLAQHLCHRAYCGGRAHPIATQGIPCLSLAGILYSMWRFADAALSSQPCPCRNPVILTALRGSRLYSTFKTTNATLLTSLPEHNRSICSTLKDHSVLLYNFPAVLG